MSKINYSISWQESARLTYTGYAAPDRLPKSAAPLNGYRPKEMPGSCPPGERLPRCASPRLRATGPPGEPRRIEL